jgi:ubiquinone/menaquinone biosynthesis C-methylase UbiE
VTSETERIAADYARRAQEVPTDRYSVYDPAHLFIRQTIERALLRALAQEGIATLDGLRVLDVGCGKGQWLADFQTYGAQPADLAGIDLLPERGDAAGRRVPGADIHVGDASELPWPDGHFDVAAQSMMFSSILDPAMRGRAATEMLRVLRPGGVVLWYDFFTRSPGNRGVRGLRRPEVERLFPGCTVRWHSVTLAPPLVRVLVPRLRAVASGLQALRVANTHAVATLRKG